MAVEKLFCDTNVLLTAIDRRRQFHAEALFVLNTLPNRGVQLYFSGQVIREFIVVCTRPVEVNGLGLDVNSTMENVRALTERCTVLEETRVVGDNLLDLVQRYGRTGKSIHDANIVATMSAHEVAALVTNNIADFSGYAEIDVIALESVASLQI